jgi:hypothetical protein
MIERTLRLEHVLRRYYI